MESGGDARPTVVALPVALDSHFTSSNSAPVIKSASPSPERGDGRHTAQVAPLDGFHLGKLLHDSASQLVRAPHEMEERYIPVALARAHLTKVVEDMHAMKEQQTTTITQIMDRYKHMEAETKSFYENYIRDLKQKAKAKFLTEQTRYTALRQESATLQQHASEEISALHQASVLSQQQHAQQHLRWREELESSLLQHEEQLTIRNDAMQSGLQTLLQLQATSMSGRHGQQVDQLTMQWEDTSARSLQLVAQARATQMRIQEKETQYETEIQQLQLLFHVEMECFKCVSTIVNHVVDMEEQTRHRKRSRELRTEIEGLGARVTVANERERALAAQLSTVTSQYEVMESRAVKQTMEMLLRTVALVPQEKKELDVKRPRPLMREGEAQTSDWTQPMERGVQVSVEVCDAMVATEETNQQHPLQDTAQRLQSDTDTDAERLMQERSQAELLRLKQELRALKTQVQACLDHKMEAKTRIKQWLSDFQTQHAREPTIEEKARVKDLYLAFKQSEEAYNTAKERTAAAKTQYHALNQRGDATYSSGGDSAKAPLQSRPSTAASTTTTVDVDTIPGMGAVSREAAQAALVNVAALEKEIDALRLELMKAQEAKQQADVAAQEAATETMRIVAEAKQRTEQHSVEAAAYTAKAAEVQSSPVAPIQERAEAKSMMPAIVRGGGVHAEEEERALERKLQEAEQLRRRQQHEQQLESYAKETQAMETQQRELTEAIATLKDEITHRTAEKEALESQIEQLRLHVELMDDHAQGGLEDEERGSDAKSVRRHEMEELEEDKDGGEEEISSQSGDDDSGADAKVVVSPLKSSTEAEKADAARETQLLRSIRESIEAGKAQWNKGDKAKCFQIYVKMCEKCIETLRAVHAGGRREEVAAFRSALQEAGRLPPAKGSMVLRRQLDACVATCEARAKERDADEVAHSAATASAVSAPQTPSPQRKTRQKTGFAVSTDASEDKSSSSGVLLSATTPLSGGGGGANSKMLDEYKQKLKALESKAKADRVKITQLEAALAKTESQLLAASSSSNSSGAGGAASTLLLERKLAEAEKKHAKALDDAEKAMKREMTALAQQLSASQTKSQSLTEQVDKLTKELSVVGGRATQLSKMEEEVTTLRTKAALVDSLSQELSLRQSDLVKMEASYKEEQTLRKKYYNQIEDMKGKIRVYARCRPMSSSETERGCDTCVRFMDEFSLELKTSHGPKTFAYDQIFTPASTQDQVFEDTKNLLQSAMDGYNVCIFAYGQTGSGKTFTMTGSETMPGLSPRAIHHLFKLAEDTSGNNSVTFQAFMLELYNDQLIDLFHLVDGGTHDNGAKLDIKKNDKGMVFVSNITHKSCGSAQQTLKLFDSANKKRQVGATKMNAESSRSHSVFSLLIENYNKTTKTTTIGKLSLVDLAGSERAGKTGATNDRLKEAQAINKSLSALGDVIAALSSGEKFIPYRNNKLTQLMQDSLGGNAKTLMFVNISPADYNQEETQTSLQYASRVKQITNNANKTSESETVNRLKAIIKQLRAGKTDVDVDGLDV